MKDWEPFKPFVLPVGSGKGANKVLGDKALFTLGGADGFRTRIVPLQTGGQLRVRTKNGMPEYIYEPARTVTTDAVISMGMTVVATLLSELYSPPYLDNGFVSPGAFSESATLNEIQYLGTQAGNGTDTGYAIVAAEALNVEPTAFNSFFRSATTRASLGEEPPSLPYSGALRAKNLALRMCPPCSFTGLARVYVSALYGKLVEDANEYSMTAVSAVSYYKLKYNDIYLDPGQVTTGIVFSSAAKRYWMVSVDGSSMVYQELSLSGDGRAIAQTISGANTDHDRVLHAYALSTARVYRTNGIVEWRSGGTFSTIGAPLNFGWRFNSDGTKFTAVAIDQYDAYVTDSRLYLGQIQINEDTSKDENAIDRFSLSVSVSVSESVIGWRNNRIKIFSPYTTTQYLWRRTGDVDEAVSAPLLSFYDIDDVLVVARFSRTLGASTPEKTTTGDGWFTGNNISVMSIPTGYPALNGACGSLTKGSPLSETSAFLECKDALAGDGATVSVGGLTLTEVRSAFAFRSEVPSEWTLLSDWTHLANIQAGYPDNMWHAPQKVDGTLTCGTAQWPSKYNWFTWWAQYRRMSTTNCTHSTFGKGVNSNASAVFVAPCDSATAWYESTFEAISESASSIVLTRAQGDQYKYVGPETLITEHQSRGQAVAGTTYVDATSYGATTLRVRTSFGSIDLFSITAGDVPKAYKLYGATESNPIVSINASVYEDMHGNVAAFDLETETPVMFGWPGIAWRSVGWQ